MSSMECATETGLAFDEGQPEGPAADPAARLRTRIFFCFGSAMALGLALAGWYVGGRILAAEQTAPANSSSVIIPAAAPSTQSQVGAPAPPAQTQTQPAVPAAIAPPPQFFLEVAGLGAKPDALFVKKLHARGLTALIDSGSEKDPRRILIGPFADHQGVEKAQRKLQAFGVLALERTY